MKKCGFVATEAESMMTSLVRAFLASASMSASGGAIGSDTCLSTFGFGLAPLDYSENRVASGSEGAVR